MQQSKRLDNTCNRFINIDILKCIAAFLVVAIHFTGHPEISSIEDWISHICTNEARIAVPLFFMITGYFYPKMVSSGHLTHQLKKLLILAIGSTLFYIVCELGGAYISGSFAKHINLIFNPQTIVDLLVFNITPGSGHLWFFYSMIYSLIIINFFDKINQTRLLNILSILLFLLLLVSNFTKFFLYTRNYLFFGIPFILLGRSFADGKLKELVSFLTISKCLFLVVSCMILIVFEVFMYYKLMPELQPQRECFIFSMPEAVAIFAITLKIKVNNSSRLMNSMALIGKKYSAYIYIFQYFAAGMGGSIYNFFFPLPWMKILFGNPVVYFLSLIISMIYLRIKGFVLDLTNNTVRN